MTEELKAAEGVLAYAANVLEKHADQLLVDAVTAAKALLPLVDEAPITEEALKAMGAECVEGQWQFEKSGYIDTYLTSENMIGWMISNSEGEDCSIGGVETLGHLRRLLTSLEFPIAKTPSTEPVCAS